MNARVSIVAPRLDEKPWGGSRLGQFGLPVESGSRIGEALITAGDAVVTSGYGAGRTLDALGAADPDGHFGKRGREATGGQPVFPLLAKLIDAREHLSIQVHPDDAVAALERKLGKTEAWFVLAAEDGAPLFVGLNRAEAFETFGRSAGRLDGSSVNHLRTVPAKPGETILLAAGTIHALGAGVMVYEIQQPSDITYRLDDWGRRDADGNPRETHLDAGLAVSRPELSPSYMPPVSLGEGDVDRQLLAACRYFALEKVVTRGDGFSTGFSGSPTVVTFLKGSGRIEGLDVATGASAVIWPTPVAVDVACSQPSEALVSWAPDLAGDVVEPCLSAGATPQAIAALAGDTGDLDDVASLGRPD